MGMKIEEMPVVTYSRRNREYEEEGNRKEVYKRVCEEALRILSGRNIGEEALKMAEDIIKKPEFEASVRKIWNEQTKKNRIVDDPEEQDKKWANGLADRLKREIFN